MMMNQTPIVQFHTAVGFALGLGLALASTSTSNLVLKLASKRFRESTFASSRASSSIFTSVVSQHEIPYLSRSS
ncbi:hypothetical protein BofuT4_uP012900.1 [Botrytis cinerea T4]|uniref:Uncharacterized protein n=1 Tax=Botryotinia fuckeliana (strain T4) TaxID=999810 RepID=G2XR13_BOTF4|nr:hypothetical protein BofuT4_uP012900.1 [Botrytis cinerea T4]